MKSIFTVLVAIALVFSSDAVSAGNTGPYSLISIDWDKMSTNYVSNVQKAVLSMEGTMTESYAMNRKPLDLVRLSGLVLRTPSDASCDLLILGFKFAFYQKAREDSSCRRSLYGLS